MANGAATPRVQRVGGIVAVAALALMFALQAFPALLPLRVREPLRWTAWYVVGLWGTYSFIWGDAADRAYEISQLFPLRGWPFLTDRVEAKRFMQRVWVGLFVFITSLYLTLILSAPRIAAAGVLALDVMLVSVSYEFLWRKPKTLLGKIATRTAVSAFLLWITGITALLIAGLVWKIDLLALVGR